MKKSRLTEAQIMGVFVRPRVISAVPELCREHGSSIATFYIYGRLSLCKRFEVFIEHDGC